MIVLVLIVIRIGIFLFGFPGGAHQPGPDDEYEGVTGEDGGREDDDVDVGGKVADDHGELELDKCVGVTRYRLSVCYLEDDQLSGCPDVGPSSQPLYLLPDHAVYEEQQEDGVNDKSALHHPHGDPVDVLQGGGLAGVLGRGGEGAGDEERK